MSKSAFGVDHGEVSKAFPGMAAASRLASGPKVQNFMAGFKGGAPGKRRAGIGALNPQGKSFKAGEKTKNAFSTLQQNKGKAAVLGGGGALTGGVYANRKRA